jgi:hypothetical protein
MLLPTIPLDIILQSKPLLKEHGYVLEQNYLDWIRIGYDKFMMNPNNKDIVTTREVPNIHTKEELECLMSLITLGLTMVEAMTCIKENHNESTYT